MPGVSAIGSTQKSSILRALEITAADHRTGGAAALLGLKPATLHAKMKRLGNRPLTFAAAPAERA